jgi:hypothetical protein
MLKKSITLKKGIQECGQKEVFKPLSKFKKCITPWLENIEIQS